jgi:hypothetical protein
LLNKLPLPIWRLDDWAEMVSTEMSMFPAGRYDDLTDSASQARLGADG